MQNYQNFIDELFRLNIETVQYFVSDGQILYDQLPQHYTAAQLANIPADQLPGNVATFMSLDQYDQQRLENRYTDMLAELQRRAITDVLLLEPAQANRLLDDAKRKCERLTQLLKCAMEYQKAWHYNTLDHLSDSFLELQILAAFTIKNRPEASPHNRFAYHLTDAIMYKRGTFSGFIKQIETTLQPLSSVTPDTVQEPEYDLWHVENNDAYAFAKLKELACYMPNIEPFTRRVEWFFEKSRIWDIEPGYMGAGRRMIPDPKFYSHRNADGKAVDKNGQRVEEIAWGVSYNNDEEKGILRKLYFLQFYRSHRSHFLNKPRLDFDHLLNKYASQVQSDRAKRVVLEWTAGEIRERQQHVTDWITANSDRYGTPEIRRQLQNVAVLIEQELEGIPAIKWDLFYRTMHLDPFALLWGLVEYKRSLETEQPTTPTISPPTNTSEQAGFHNYIEEGKLMPYLIENYTDASPEQIGFMLYALVGYGYLKPSVLNSNQSALHRALTNTFGKIGTRQALNTAILRLDEKGSSDADKRNIKAHEHRIAVFLKTT